MLPCRVYDLLSDNCERLSTFHTAQTPFSSAETSRFPAGAHFKRPTRPVCGEFTSRAEFSLKIHNDTIPANQMGHVRRMHTRSTSQAYIQPTHHRSSQLQAHRHEAAMPWSQCQRFGHTSRTRGFCLPNKSEQRLKPNQHEHNTETHMIIHPAPHTSSVKKYTSRFSSATAKMGSVSPHVEHTWR